MKTSERSRPQLKPKFPRLKRLLAARRRPLPRPVFHLN